MTQAGYQFTINQACGEALSDRLLGEYPDTSEGDFMKHVKAVVAEYERAKTTERTARARLLKAKAGQVVGNGGPPYGYQLEKDASGRTMLVVHEPEARIVRLMFMWYVYGGGESGPMSYRAIARQLNAMEVPTWADTHWKCGRERLGGWWTGAVTSIMQNETYVGIWRYAGIVVQVPALVDREYWDAADVGKQDKTRRKGTRKYEYLLAGRVRCGLCNKSVAGTGKAIAEKVYRYYQCCGSNHEHGERCQLPRFQADRVDADVWGWVKEALTDPKSLERGLRKYAADCERANAPILERMKIVNDLLADNREQLDRLLDLYLSGDFPKEVLTDRKARLEATIAALEHERAGLVAQVQTASITDEQVMNLQRFAAKVAQGVDLAAASYEEKRGLLADLKLTATLTAEDGYEVVYARGAAGSKKFRTPSRATGIFFSENQLVTKKQRVPDPGPGGELETGPGRPIKVYLTGKGGCRDCP